MAAVMIVIGAGQLLFGAIIIGWVLWARGSSWIAYLGVMFVALGGVFILGNALPPSPSLYAIIGILAIVVFWSGWKHVRIIRLEEGQ